MNREEKILNDNEQLALKIADELSEGREFECDSLDIYTGAMKMADWKDQHPKKGLWDSEKVIMWLRANVDNYANYNVRTDECFVNDFEEDYMHLPKERLAELLVERDSLEETIEDKIAEKIAELLNKPPFQLPQQPDSPYQPISVLYGCPSDFPDIIYSTNSNSNT